MESTSQANENNGESTSISLSELVIDGLNPRFGKKAGSFSDEVAIVDYIVDDFGVDTLLSSLAYNGYFDAEPLIVKPTGDNKYLVVEGNRRLAACLILAGDRRAKHQAQRTKVWREKTKGIPWNSETKVPVKIFRNDQEIEKLLPYLGVRHIVSSQPWDSHAKAKWIADVVDKGNMTLDC